MVHTVTLPSIGETIESATIDEWLVNVGDDVEKGEPILQSLQIAALEVESTATGKIVAQLVLAGASQGYDSSHRLNKVPGGEDRCLAAQNLILNYD